MGFPSAPGMPDHAPIDPDHPHAERQTHPHPTLPLKGRAKAEDIAMKTTLQTAEQLNLDWSNNPRWNGVTRSYCADDMVRLRGPVHVEPSLARSEERRGGTRGVKTC